MPIIEFVGQSSRDSDSIVSDPSRLVNIYREKAGDGVPWLKSVLAMMPHSDLPGVFVTAMGVVGGRLFAVCGGVLFEVTADGSYERLGDVATGPATLAGNNGYVTVQAGTRYFVWDIAGATLTEQSAAEIAAFGSLEFFGNYTILTEDGGRRFGWSDLADPTTLPALNFSTADGRDDLLVRAFAVHGQLWLFKQESHERWYLTGQAGAAALERISGGVQDVGLRGHGLIARFPGGAFLVGSDNRASLVTPGGLQPVSTPAVETAIKTKRPSRCVVYEDEGHVFLCIVFRRAPAWCYDLATGEWHERSEGENSGAWRAATSAKFGQDWYIGRDDGRISIMQRTDVDGTVPLVREATSRTLYVDGNRTIIRELEFFARNGFSDAMAEISLSRDGGNTWGPWKAKPFGMVGDYDRRIIYRNLGQARRMNIRLRWTKSANITISSQARVTI